MGVLDENREQLLLKERNKEKGNGTNLLLRELETESSIRWEESFGWAFQS